MCRLLRAPFGVAPYRFVTTSQPTAEHVLVAAKIQPLMRASIAALGTLCLLVAFIGLQPTATENV